MRLAFKYEQRLWRRGLVVVGADEVGRGALAGPIVAAVVILSPKILKSKAVWPKQVNDSKKLTAEVRILLYNQITKNSHWAIAALSNKQIDKIGIQPANILVVNKAVSKLKKSADYLLVDYIAGFKSPHQHKCIIKGDQKVFSIACASIVAKVYRDGLMKKLHKKYPKYYWDKNKGYGSVEHRRVVKKFGLSPLHRKSFNTL